jgi:hypothetical protein
MYVCGGVANVFYQSCAQIDNNQQVYEVQIQVPKCNSILKAGVKSRVHFILIDVRVSTQTKGNSPYIINVCMLFSSWARSCFWIGVSTPHQIFPHPLFLFILYFIIIITIFTFILFKGCIHQITTKLLI